MRSKGLNIKVPRLGINRFGVYYVRSSSLDATGRRKVSQQSLDTKDPQLAKVLALKFCLNLVSGDVLSDFRKKLDRYEFDLATGKAKSDGADDHARMLEAMKAMQDVLTLQSKLQPQVSAVSARVSQVASGPAADLVALASQLVGKAMPGLPKPNDVGLKLRQALDMHLEEEAPRLKKAETVAEKRVLFQEFSEHFGDIHLNELTKIDISERWRKAEFTRPNKKRKGQTLSLARLEKRRGYLAKFFEWAIARGSYVHANPAKQLMGTKKEIRAKQRPWAEFTEDDLKCLFGEHYRARMTEPDWYWLPLIALYSGARLAEIANLTLGDIVAVEGTKVMMIADAKTPSGVRTVPVHSALLELGLWTYVENLRNLGFDRLLPNRPAHKPEKMAGRMWGKWISECGITDDAKVFHSFSSTAITDLHNAEASHAGIHRAVGHATAGIKGTHGKYVRGIQLKLLKDVIEKLQHPTVNIATLKRDDPGFGEVLEELRRKATDPSEIAKKERLARHRQMRAEREARVARGRKRTPSARPAGSSGNADGRPEE